jgi:hypothetical protein
MKAKTTIGSSLALLGGLLLGATATEASELPPADGKPLSAIIKSVEDLGLGVIRAAEFDDGLWEVAVCKGRDCLDLYMDPRTAQEQRRKNDDTDDALPPGGAKPLSEVIRSLEAQNLGTITDVEFENGFWETELRKDGRKVRVDLDPGTGKTRS